MFYCGAETWEEVQEATMETFLLSKIMKLLANFVENLELFEHTVSRVTSGWVNLTTSSLAVGGIGVSEFKEVAGGCTPEKH